MGVCVTPPLLHSSTVHGSLSSIMTGVCCGPLTGSQVSSVQMSPSSNAIGVWLGPVCVSQRSVVHAFLSSMIAGVFTQVPASQRSSVHASPSSQLPSQLSPAPPAPLLVVAPPPLPPATELKSRSSAGQEGSKAMDQPARNRIAAERT